MCVRLFGSPIACFWLDLAGSLPQTGPALFFCVLSIVKPCLGHLQAAKLIHPFGYDDKGP